MPSIYLLTSSFRKRPPEAKGALFSPQNAAQPVSCGRGQGRALPRNPSATGSPGTHPRGPLFPRSGTHLGPGCLPGGSVSVWPASLCTTAGYVTVSLLLCSLRTTARPVLDKRTAVTEQRRNPPGHSLTAVSHRPEASRSRERDRPAPRDSLAVGTSLSSHVCLPEASDELALALAHILHLLKRKSVSVPSEENPGRTQWFLPSLKNQREPPS